MTLSEGFQVAALVVGAIGCVGSLSVPFVLRALGRQDRHRQEHFDAIYSRISEVREDMGSQIGKVHAKCEHIDDCVDDLKKVVHSKMASREDMAAAIAQLGAGAASARNAIEQRVYRLESRAFGERNGE